MISLLNEFDKPSQCEHYVQQFVQLYVQQLHGVNATADVPVKCSIHTVQLLHRQFLQTVCQLSYSVNGV